VSNCSLPHCVLRFRGCRSAKPQNPSITTRSAFSPRCTTLPASVQRGSLGQHPYRGCINKTFHYLGMAPVIPRQPTVESSIAMMSYPPNGARQPLCGAPTEQSRLQTGVERTHSMPCTSSRQCFLSLRQLSRFCAYSTEPSFVVFLKYLNI